MGALDTELTVSYPFFGVLFGCMSGRIGGQRQAEVCDPLGAAIARRITDALEAAALANYRAV
jgi:hypothetical protein